MVNDVSSNDSLSNLIIETPGQSREWRLIEGLNVQQTFII